MANSQSNYQLIHPLLSVQLDSDNGRSLVRIPANSIVKRAMTLSPLTGLVEVLWQDRRCLVFDEDLKKQDRIFEKSCKAGS